jgi:hypothetical protein
MRQAVVFVSLKIPVGSVGIKREWDVWRLAAGISGSVAGAN